MNWKKKAIQVLWVLAGIGVVVLLGAAMQQKNHKVCADVKIEITGAEKDMFIDEKDIMDILNSNDDVKGKEIATIDLRKMEEQLEKNPWVKNAELFFDNNDNKQVLTVSIEERQPIARVFTMQGNSFYLDTAATRLPLSDKVSARVPVFTSFPSDKKIMAQSDSLLMKDVIAIGKYIMNDSFWMAQTAQIDITPQATFELLPVVGNHVVALGKANDLENKLNRLYTFYKEAWLQNGINKYEKLDVQYSNQVVAVKRGTYQAIVDSAKAAQAMHDIMNVHRDTANTISTAQVNRMNNAKPDTVRHIVNTPKPIVHTNNNQVARPSTHATSPAQPKPKPPKPNNQPRAVLERRN